MGDQHFDATIRTSRRDKYKPVEESMRRVKLAVEDARSGGHLKTPSLESPARLVDLGCGNARPHLRRVRVHLSSKSSSFDTTFHMEVVGVDIKKQTPTNTRSAVGSGPGRSVRFAGAIAGADVSSFRDATRRHEEQVEIVLALHACDTADGTKRSREPGRWRAPARNARGAVPPPRCLQVLKVSSVPPANSHRAGGVADRDTVHPAGRLGDVLTDAFRAHVLRLRVWVDNSEFQPRTPSNTMIRRGAHEPKGEADVLLRRAFAKKKSFPPRLAEIDARARGSARRGDGVRGRGRRARASTYAPVRITIESFVCHKYVSRMNVAAVVNELRARVAAYTRVFASRRKRVR